MGRLRHFLRASFDQHERALAPLEEELTIVRMYLDIEMLRFDSRLNVEQAIDPGLSKVLVPPFSFQPLVEESGGAWIALLVTARATGFGGPPGRAVAKDEG